MTNGDPNLVTTALPLDLKEYGKVNLKETSYHSFIVLKKQTVLGGTLKLGKEFYKNLDIKFTERTINWNLPKG